MTRWLALLVLLLAPPALAEVGDVYIAYADLTGTDLVLNDEMAPNPIILQYNTEVTGASTIIDRQGDEESFRIQDSGRYLIMSTTSWDYADIPSNQRHVVRTEMWLNQAIFPGITGMASGYGRDSGSANESHVLTFTYIDHTVDGTANDDILFKVENYGDFSNGLSDQFGDQSGIMIVRMPDDAAWLQVTWTTDTEIAGGGYTTTRPADGDFTTIPWQNQIVETDTAVIEWTSGTDVTLKETGHYLVLWHVESNEDSGTRSAMRSKLMLNDSNIVGSPIVTHWNRSANGADENWTATAVIIEATAADVLTVDIVSDGENGAIDDDLDEMALTVVRLPDDADYVRIHNDGDTPGEDEGFFPFDAEGEDPLGLHDNATNNHRINGTSNNDDWLFLAYWALTVDAVNSTRTGEHFQWSRTGTIVKYGAGESYTRGDQGSSGIYHGGRSAAIIAHDLGASEWMALDVRMEAFTGDQNRVQLADRVGISGINLSSMAPASVARRVIVTN